MTIMRNYMLGAAIACLIVTGCGIEGEHTPNNSSQQNEGNIQSIAFSGGSIQMVFPEGWYENESEHPFDLQYWSQNRRMNSGIFVYHPEDLAESSTPQNTFEWQIDDLRSKRNNFTTIEPIKTETLPDKSITTAVYAGEQGESRFYYKISLVEFSENYDGFLIAIQVAIPSEWNSNKSILEGILNSTTVHVVEQSIN